MEEYHRQISELVSNGTDECQPCLSTFQTLRDAAQKISPEDITSLLTQLCTDKVEYFITQGEDCKAVYGGSGSQGPYWAKVLYSLDDKTDDMRAICKFKTKIKKCSPPATALIKESDWFKNSKPSQPRVAPKSNPSGNWRVHCPLTSADWYDRQNIRRRPHVGHSFGFRVGFSLPKNAISDVTEQGTSWTISEDSPRWGNFSQDTPGDLLLSAFSTMKNLIKMDDVSFALFTGDIVDHVNDVQTSIDYVKFEEEKVFDAFKAEMTNGKGNIVSPSSQILHAKRDIISLTLHL